MRPPRRTLPIILALVLGAILWLTIGHRDGLDVRTLVIVAIAIFLAALPNIREPLARALDRVRRPSARHKHWTALAIAIICITYLLITARLQDRDMIPKFHDEHMHLLQARMLAAGKLAMPPHPLGEFFDSFHLMMQPKYASVYFPGASLLYVPAIWFNLPHYVLPLLAAAASAALLYLIVTDLLDGVAGLLAALMLISLTTFRFVAMVTMSHIAMLFLGLLLIWSYLHWRKHPTLPRAALIGAIAGFAAITRPLDALAYAIPVALSMLMDLRPLMPSFSRGPRAARNAAARRIAAAHVAILITAAIPFLSLQLLLNATLTGHPFHLPPQLLRPGFDSTEASAQSTLPQKRYMDRDFFQPQLDRHRNQSLARTWLTDRLPLLADAALPNALLLILIPLGVLALFLNPPPWHGHPARVDDSPIPDTRSPQTQRLWLLPAMLPFFLAAYALFPFFLAQYAIITAPAIILLALLGYTVLAAQSRIIDVALTTLIAGLAIAALPEINRSVIDDGHLRPVMWFAAREMPNAVKPPAIVLFRYTPGDNVHEEPVYNTDVLWPDDAAIIRAHDLGVQKDRELFAYYAQRQPQRTVYLFDRASRQLVQLGNVSELARRKSEARNALCWACVLAGQSETNSKHE